MISITIGDVSALPLAINLRCYFAWVLTGQLLVRSAMSFVRSVEYHYPATDLNGSIVRPRSASHVHHGLVWNTINDFSGFHPDVAQRDWGQSLILGLIELATFPVLIQVNKWEAIGAWIGLKAVPHWKQWLSHGESYSRFFIGNGLVVSVSFELWRKFFV